MLVQKVYERAEEVNITLSPRLNFMLRISESVNAVDDEIKSLNPIFISDSIKKEILGKVPENLIIDQMDAHFMLLHKIDSINFQLANKIANQINRISAAFRFDDPEAYEDDFDVSFDNFIVNKVKKKHMIRIDKDLYAMKAEYCRLQKIFSMEIAAIRKLKVFLETDIAKAKIMFLNLLESTAQKGTNKTFEDIASILDKITVHKNDLYQYLSNLLEIVEHYNEQRSAWAAFLIGMKPALPSFSRPVKLDALISLIDFATGKNCFIFKECMKEGE